MADVVGLLLAEAGPSATHGSLPGVTIMEREERWRVKQAIAVVGVDPCDAAEAAFAQAMGSAIASDGLVLVTGGRGGVMAAASRGARNAGGLVVGILPGVSRSEANEFVDVAIPTGMGELRNGLVVAAANLVLAIGGEYGTLSEIALALKTGKTVIGWQTWPLTKPSGQQTSIISVASVEEARDQIQKVLALK